MSARNSVVEKLSSDKRNSGDYNSDGEMEAYKKEFEQREQIYRKKLSSLKIEVSHVKEHMSRVESDLNETKEKTSVALTVYANLDEATREKL